MFRNNKCFQFPCKIIGSIHICLYSYGFSQQLCPLSSFYSCALIYTYFCFWRWANNRVEYTVLLTDIYIHEAKYKHRWFLPTDGMENDNIPSEATVLQVPRGRNQDKKEIWLFHMNKSDQFRAQPFCLNLFAVLQNWFTAENDSEQRKSSNHQSV